MKHGTLKVDDLPKIEDLTEEDLKSISGGKSVMPASKLQGYRLLKIQDQEWFNSNIIKR
jgi:hypothetical protein